jgi:glycosyltransferase involved in cell wall biosynthesis
MAFLKTSIDSVLNQIAEDFEYEFLICDDCSTDKSFAFLQQLNHPKIQLFKNETNKGLFPTLNFLLKQAKAPLVHLWAQDDIMLPHCLKETLKFHQEFPEVNFSFSRLQNIDQHGNLFKKPGTFENRVFSVEGHAVSSILYGSISGNIANVCLVKKACEDVGYFDESMIYVGDFKMWCLLSKKNPIGMNGNILVHVRQHRGQLSRNLKASYHKLIENYEVYQCFLDTLPAQYHKAAQAALNWKIYPYYFNQYLYILRKKEFDLAKRYRIGLKKYSPIPVLALRWMIVRVLDALRLKASLNKRLVDNLENLRQG